MAVLGNVIVLLGCICSGQADCGAGLGSWLDVEKALLAHPAAFEEMQTRRPIFKAVDALYLKEFGGRTVAEGLSAPHHELAAFYQRQVDRALDALEKPFEGDGVEVWKFYSCSVVLRSREGTVALDFCQGPLFHAIPEETTIPHGLYWRPEQRARLAALLDAMLITHWHADHNDTDMMNRLAARGKPILVTPQMKQMAENAGAKAELAAPDYNGPQRAGPCELRVLKGCQYMSVKDFNTRPLPAPGPGDVENNVYWVRMGGLSFLHVGDNWTPLDTWLAQGKEEGWDMDVVFWNGFPSCLESIGKVFDDTLRITTHDHEVTHPDGGNPIAGSFDNEELVAARRVMPLLWGEGFRVTAQR